ncbi:MAG: class I SAM-dependent methyltransferase [Chloroflexi bacterium]|nr:class I SAM-dependent methyltransferase [Chloroflexota bacterium]
MNSATAARLIAINREFYDQFGDAFSATRGRLQPGVLRILDSLRGDESILDLGCGNGEVARELARRGHRAPYLGLDFSLPLLRAAESPLTGFHAQFREADITSPGWTENVKRLTARPELVEGLNVVLSFAVFHHIPSEEIRLNLFRTVHELLVDDGRFILSNWQFLNSEKLKARIQPWELAGLTSADVDAGDHLLDWKRGGTGLRYAHHFSAEELSALARQTGFRVVDSFLSDGEGGRLGLYQVWVKNGMRT